MSVQIHEETLTFHLCNDQLSYILNILPNGEPGSVYFGSRLNDERDYAFLHRRFGWGQDAVSSTDTGALSMGKICREYPSGGTGDFRLPAYIIRQENGSTASDYRYTGYRVFRGKKPLPGLPATYVEEDSEADTLELILSDQLTGGELCLSYTVFSHLPVIARSTCFVNRGNEKLVLNTLMSTSIDFPDRDFEMITLNGAWARERHATCWPLHEGVQEIRSNRGISSAEFNPFFALKRPNADEFSGEVYGFSLVYSGNHCERCELDTTGMLRCNAGINPEGFAWAVRPGESFWSPECVMVYSESGLNGMSNVFHKLYRTRLARGKWRDLPRPILFNNWEATEMSFTEERLLAIVRKAKGLGAELFVLDDGWFGARNNDHAGLGDWDIVNYNKLPDGLDGFAEKVRAEGLGFGFWIEPEMVNEDSALYRAHPDWVISAPGRHKTLSRNQMVLDFSKKEVTDHLYQVLRKQFAAVRPAYIKWDMNRCLTEVFSSARPAEEQGENFHRYILGVYSLYERLTSEFPEILFESCSSGGARFDPGLLYYAPQGWTSDCTDAIKRITIQYGTSFVYPLSSIGAHVSSVPNQQNGRTAPLSTRYHVASFGMLGYELDPLQLSDEEQQQIAHQIAEFKQNRALVEQGNFYRLADPAGGRRAAWIVVSEDRREALLGVYRLDSVTNQCCEFLRLYGLDPNLKYHVEGYPRDCHGDELMKLGLMLFPGLEQVPSGNYSSLLIRIHAI